VFEKNSKEDKQMKKFLSALLIVMMCLALAACGTDEPAGNDGAVEPKGTLLMATTTSTDNTGLLDYLAPIFAEDTGWTLEWSSVGTGEALAMGQTQKVRETFANAMQLAILIVLPATVGLMTLAYPIIELLYPVKPDAGLPMFWSAAVVLMVGLYQISAGTLQGMGKAMVPMYSLLLGAAIKIVLTYTLTAMPALGIRGAALASVIGFGVAAANNIWQVSRRIGWEWLSLQYHIVKPVISVAAMAVLVLAVYSGVYTLLSSNGTGTLVSIMIGGCAYFAVLLAIGGVSLEIIRKMPKVGNRLANLLLKLKVVKE
jgi:stage V sporulation protein B